MWCCGGLADASEKADENNIPNPKKYGYAEDRVQKPRETQMCIVGRAAGGNPCTNQAAVVL